MTENNVKWTVQYFCCDIANGVFQTSLQNVAEGDTVNSVSGISHTFRMSLLCFIVKSINNVFVDNRFKLLRTTKYCTLFTLPFL